MTGEKLGFSVGIDLFTSEGGCQNGKKMDFVSGDRTVYSVPRGIRRGGYSQREMRCGEELTWRENKLWKKGKGDRAVAQLSAACSGRVKRFENRGYQITSARIRAMVFWKPDDEYPGEIMIILPDLVLTRKDQV